jgi:hypothetical protein
MSEEDQVTYGAGICALCITGACIALSYPLWAWMVGMLALCLAIVIALAGPR